MELLTTEEQQVEAIKQWWKENWASVIGGVLIGIGIIFGGRMWLQNQDLQARSASAAYEAMMSAMNSGQTDISLEFSTNLMTQFADSPYAAFAALSSARVKLEQNDAVAGRAHLQWVIDNAGDEELQHIARVRLARLLLAEGEFAEAIKLANAGDGSSFRGSYDEIKGDAYLAQQQPEQARAAYASALAHLDPAAGIRELIQMKLDNLGAANEVVQAGS